MPVLRHFIREESGLFRIVPENRQLLLYYANAISYFFDRHE